MLISIDWIKDFIDLDLKKYSAQEIGQRVTLSTAEVEEVVEVGAHLEHVRVAEIVSIRKHPEADQLNLVTFRYHPQEKEKEVVCGAPNVQVGLKVPYAAIGTTLPNGLTLQPKKIRGVVSEGMLCSQEELNLPVDVDGLMVLDKSAPIGQTMLEYLQEKRDILLNIDNKSLTHRPDLWGHYGFAREFACIFKLPLKNPFAQLDQVLNKLKKNSPLSPIKPVIEGDTSCLIYYGLSLSGVKVEASPAWMQKRLTDVGLRPINNIVDISNYCMLELGIPMHIFDRDLIEGNKIIIKRLSEETTFTTLDGVERKLVAGDTVIADSEKPLVLAGIMGGENSGVTEKTTNLFLEVANWKASEVRKTSTRLGLRTDSSQRYEKTLDSLLCQRTLLRAVELIISICPQATIQLEGQIEVVGADFENKIKTPFRPLVIESSYLSLTKKLGLTLGEEITEERIDEIFRTLDFKIKKNQNQNLKDKISFEVPSFRSTKDIEGEADLVEELGRIVGYDNIKPISPLGEIAAIRLSPAKELQRKIRDYFVMNVGALEITTYPIVGEKLLQKAKWPYDPQSPLILQNSLSIDHDRMRPSLIPSVLEVAALNYKHYDRFKLFELGRTYQDFESESSQVIFAFYQKNSSASNPSSLSLFTKAMNSMERLMNFLQLNGEMIDQQQMGKFKNHLIPSEWVGCHPQQLLHVKIMGKVCGGLVSVHPLVLRNFKMTGQLVIGLLDLTSFEQTKAKEKSQYKPLTKFPPSTFDCTVVASAQTPVGDLLKCLKKIKLKELVSTKIVDIYQMSDELKSVTLRTVFLDTEQTLSGEFLEKAQESIVKTLDEAGFKLKTV